MAERAGRSRLFARVGLGLVLGVVVVFGALMISPRMLGWQAITIVSGSMAPTVHRGDVVVLDPAPGWPVPVGTVVTYRQPGSGILVTHRVVSVDPGHRAYVTRGDANPVNDSRPVPADAVLGRVRLLVPMAGWPTLLPGAHVVIPVVLIGLGAAAGRGLHRYLARRSPLGRIRRRPLVAGLCLIAATVGAAAPGEAALGSSTAQFTANTAASVGVGTTAWSLFTRQAWALRPVSYWPLDETGTTAADLTGGNPMTYIAGPGRGQPRATSGTYGNSVALTARTQGAMTANGPANLNLHGPMSMMAWVKLPTGVTNTTFGRIAAKYDDNNPGSVSYMMALSSDTTSLRFFVDLSAGTPARPIASVPAVKDSAWHFYVGTWDGATVRLYKDGALANSAVVTGPGQIVSTVAPVVIGSPSFNESVLGGIDEVAVWDRALTASEISALYTTGTT